MNKEPRNTRRRQKRRILRRLLPAAVAISLIFIIAFFWLLTGLFNKLRYSSARADLDKYFKIEQEGQIPIMLNDEYTESMGTMKDDRYYVTMDFATENLCDGFYYDEYDDQILYTTASDTLVSKKESGDFYTEGETVYLATDYLQKLVNMSVMVHEGPIRLEIKNTWGEIEQAGIKKGTSVRVLGGPKSEILTDLPKDGTVTVMEKMDNWCKVKTPDGFIGYIENKHLKDEKKVTETPVTDVQEEEIIHNLRDHKICLGWHQVTSSEANATFDEVVSNTKGMNVISPTWMRITDTMGSVSCIGDTGYVAKAHERGYEVWALVDNFDKEVDTHEVLAHTSSRRILEQNIVDECLRLGVDGINIDFESLDSKTGKAFAQFIREISVMCRQQNLVLSVDNYVPRGHTIFYDRKTQGKYADYVIIMGYDEHYASSEEAGSVASFNFVQEGIEKTLMDVDAAQVINAVPFYTRIWDQEKDLTSMAVGMAAAREFANNHGIKFAWDETCAQDYGEITEGSSKFMIWMEDAKSIEVKLSLMETNSLAGVACWKLGMETPDVWDVIDAYLKQ